MMPASTNGGGNCALPGPTDSCKTPTPTGPMPMPYPNMAQLTQADGGSCSSKVTILNKKTVVHTSKISMSSGDEAGSVGGVVSNGIKGEVQFKGGSSKVTAEGKKIAHNTVQTAHNGSNANAQGGSQIAPSQSKVMVAS